MTINFIPGEVNGSETSVLHAIWKLHYIIVYGSGNNLIINCYANKKETLQTIYLDHDPTSIDINDLNGLILVGIGHKIIVYKPLNEFMKIPKWTEFTSFSIADSSVNCLQWAPIENELIVGTDSNLQLYKFTVDSTQIRYQLLWIQDQPIPVSKVNITYNANKIVVQNGSFDRLLKIWSRINYDVNNTLFELTYIDHPLDDYVISCNWRFKVYSNVTPQPQPQGHPKLDRSLTSIKNFRNFMDSSLGVNDDDFDTLFTLSKNGIFRIWSSYELSGHSQIKCWGQLDLASSFAASHSNGSTNSGSHSSDISSPSFPCNVILIENYYLQQLNFDSRNPIYKYLQSHRNDMDLLLAIDNLGNIVVYLILNVATIPPNSIKFDKIMTSKFNPHSFLEVIPDSNELSAEILCNPIIVQKVKHLTGNQLLVLIHNRIKNTLKFNVLNLNLLLTKAIGSNLVNKFQGSEKSIKKLVKSNNNSLVLSISNFPQYNYIWKSLVVKKLHAAHTTLTKKFTIDLNKLSSDAPHHNSTDNYIIDALIIDDCKKQKENSAKPNKQHLVITYDKQGNLSLWDCNEFQFEDKCADLLWSTSLQLGSPRIFQLLEVNDNEYIVILIFDFNVVKCWKLVDCCKLMEFKIANLPIDEDYLNNSEPYFSIYKFESHINDSKNLVSIIDKNGYLNVYSIKADNHENPQSVEWIKAFSLHTNIKNCSKIIGSSIINKLAVVDESGSKLCVFDLSSGLLEFEHLFQGRGKIEDIDWCVINTNTNNNENPAYSVTNNVLLSVGFLRSVALFTQLRYDYTHKVPTYAIIKEIDISEYTTHKIGDSIWINNGYLVIGCGNQFFIDDRWFQLGSSSDHMVNNITRQLVKGFVTDNEKDLVEKDNIDTQKDAIFDLSDIVRILNGPLPVYHPQFLIQLLYMNQYELVKSILVKLFQAIRNDTRITWNLDMEFINEISGDKPIAKNSKFTVNLDLDLDSDQDVFSTFNEHLVDLLVRNLTKISLPLITRHQQITLTSIITIVKLIDENHQLLDDNGIRFLVGLKLFQLSTNQASLNVRDIAFAIHSNHKDLLLNIIEENYNYKFTWDLIKNLKLIYWVNNFKLLEIVENYIRNEFNQTRDPSGLISLIYITLNKKQLLIGLWRTVNHKDKDKLLKFLSNDFNEKRWQVAAMKNAFALLGKHRYLDAAYFFLLAGKVQDCCSILNNKLNDFDLALLVSKLYSFARNDQVDLKPLMTNYLLSSIISSGNKWLCSWMFYELKDIELSIVALIKPPIKIFNNDQTCKYLTAPDNIHVDLSSKNFLNEDPALILLYNSIKFKKLSRFINISAENKFLLKICSIYNKMGCDYLALILLMNWKFNYPSISNNDTNNGDIKPRVSSESITGASGSGSNPQEAKEPNMAPPQAAFEEPDMSAFDFGF